MVRPGLNKFLTELSNHYEIVIYTAGLQDYADWIINQIDRKKRINHRLYRQHTQREEHYAVKDLRLIGRDLAKTIIVDNIKENYMYTTPDNGLEITSWYDDLDDNELDKYQMFLKEIATQKEQDVRVVISQYRHKMDEYVWSRNT